MMKLALILTSALIAGGVFAGKTRITIRAHQPRKHISPDLFGIFFEDINYAADGGLYAGSTHHGNLAAPRSGTA